MYGGKDWKERGDCWVGREISDNCESRVLTFEASYCLHACFCLDISFCLSFVLLAAS
jgi:hypothetical protein